LVLSAAAKSMFK
jgi:hypothetical protein